MSYCRTTGHPERRWSSADWANSLFLTPHAGHCEMGTVGSHTQTVPQLPQRRRPGSSGNAGSTVPVAVNSSVVRAHTPFSVKPVASIECPQDLQLVYMLKTGGSRSCSIASVLSGQSSEELAAARASPSCQRRSRHGPSLPCHPVSSVPQCRHSLGGSG